MTNWLASRSRWNTISPVSGHLIHRFSGTSRLARKLRIFGRTTLLIQLTALPVPIRPPRPAPRARRRQARRRGPLTAATVDGVARPSPSSEVATASTRAEPTTTPSAARPIAAACAAVLTPKPTATGNMVCRLILVTASADLRRVGRGRAGDAEDRDVVDEAGGVGEHGRQPPVVGGRRRQPDEVDAALHRRQAKLVVVLGRQVDDDQAVDAGRLARRRGSARCPSGIDRVVVAHQDDRRVVVALAEGAHHGRASCSWSGRRPAPAGPTPGSPGRRPSGRRTACRSRSGRRRPPAAP